MLEQETERISPIEYLRILRDDYSNEIPEQVLHGPVTNSDRKKFKVRRNWWNGVVGGLGRLRLKGLVPTGLEQEVQDFVDHYSSEEFHSQPLTTAEDIARANEIITKIVGDR
ncbi:MAG: hypothetical protein HYU80_02670 [Candidatus Blackburnbacteria bacterium]|nr:hypothetical protein [Candidatus Blackburnbacteria bacterium]